MNTTSNSQDIALTLLGTDAFLALLIPVLIVIITIAIILCLILLFGISARLAQISDKLSDANDNALRGPLSPEEYLGFVEQRHRQNELAKQTHKSHIATALGVVIGLIVIVFGVAQQDEVTKNTLLGAGATIAIISIVLPLIPRRSTKKLQQKSPANIEQVDTPQDDANRSAF